MRNKAFQGTCAIDKDVEWTSVYFFVRLKIHAMFACNELQKSILIDGKAIYALSLHKLTRGTKRTVLFWWDFTEESGNRARSLAVSLYFSIHENVKSV